MSLYQPIRRLPRDLKRSLLIYGVLGLVLWPIPLFNILHVESAAVVAFVAFFTAGFGAIGAFERGDAFPGVLRRQEGALLLPWAMLTISLLWAPNCGYLLGLLFYVLFPAITVVLAICVAFAVSGTSWKYKRFALVGLGAVIVVGGPVYDLALHPQLYTYNHIFGGVLGPIYDEQLAIRPGLFAFRMLTLFWAAVAFGIGLYLRGQAVKAWLPVAVLLIGASYLAAPWLGFVTPGWRIQEELGNVHHTAHFSIYHDASSLADEDVQEIADELEYRHVRLKEKLGMAENAADPQARPPDRIAVYLYPSPDVKANLTGARYTSVAPIWLPEPQMHLLEDRFARSGAHELVHVFSRQFARTFVNISPVAGLIEGVAVALEPPSGVPSPHEQVGAAALMDAFFEPGKLARNLRQRLRPLGFWTGRGAVSYTTVGSFVDYLLHAYGPEAFREVYRTGAFERIYGKPLRELAAEWEVHVMGLSIKSAASAEYVAPRFAVPSLFERPCPHYVPRHVRRHREAARALTEQDTSRARTEWRRALDLRDDYQSALIGLARLERARGNPQAIFELLDPLDEDRPDRLLLQADAFVLKQEMNKAREQYYRALQRMPLHERDARSHLTFRIALLDTPSVLLEWMRGGTSADLASRVSEEASMASHHALAGLLWLNAGESERAVHHWRTEVTGDSLPTTPRGDRVVFREWLRWNGYAYYRMGEYEQARWWYNRAAGAYAKVGDLNARDHMRDLARKMEAMQDELI